MIPVKIQNMVDYFMPLMGMGILSIPDIHGSVNYRLVYPVPTGFS
jgi:hypothetical protein